MASHITATYTIGRERTEAQNRLVDFVLPRLRTGVHSRHLIYELVSKFYGKSVDLNDLAERFDVNAFVVVERWGQVVGILKSVQERSYHYAENHYSEAGMVVSQVSTATEIRGRTS